MRRIQNNLARVGFVSLQISLLGLLGACGTTEVKTVSVAIAANFTEPAKEIAVIFQKATGYSAVMSFGSTAQLFTQISQDAPFEVFLAADQKTPRKAVNDGFAVEGSLITYALGKLVLFSPTIDVSNGEAVLREGRFAKLAIANPTTAPYGAAAVDAMKALKVDEQLREKIVQGNNITQTFQFVESGNAEVGFVALSQVVNKDAKSIWIVPDSLYSPIRQDAVLLKKGAQSEGARAFMKSLKTPEVLAVIEKYGYTHSP
jgi:molybdate transport system substrate-binding protein